MLINVRFRGDISCLTEKMEEMNTDLNKLKGNKRAHKAAVNRIRASTEDEIAKYASEDPTGKDVFLGLFGISVICILL